MDKIIRWSIPVSKALDGAVENQVSNGKFSTKSDLIRYAVRKLVDEVSQ